MLTKIALAALALACGLDGGAFAASAAAPHMARGHTGTANAPAATETANQITARKTIGASVHDRSGKEVAAITDLIINRRQHAVALAVLKPAGAAAYHGRPIMVAWKSLAFQPVPTPRFVTALDRKALADGTPFRALKGRARHNPAYYDVQAELMGHKVVGPHGVTLGHVQNVVFNDRSGRLVALVIDTAGVFNIGANYHAVAWNAARPHGDRPVRIALSKAEVDSAPVTNTMTPRPVPTHAPGSVPAVIHRNQTGNLSGTSVPGPATRR
jgi:sporulation protein YlmC with PRC-barrel domain